MRHCHHSGSCYFGPMRILYIDIDSQRADHFGCYGYHRNTTPAIDQIASEGVRFTNAYACDAPCLPSRTAFYSGRLGIQTGVVGHGGTAAEPKREGSGRGFSDRFSREGLAGQLQQAGLHTAMISPFGQRHAAWHFYASFNEIHNTGLNGNESAEHVTPVVKKWLDDHASEDNWYLHLNFWDPHTVHRVPLAYGEPFADDPIPAWLDDEELIEQHMALPGPHTIQDIGMYHGTDPAGHPRQINCVTNRSEMKKLIDGYDTAIRYVDDQIAMICEKLKAAGVYEETAIIISADHGENYGELGIYAEHGTADQGTCHIPLIIKWPGGEIGQVDTGLHYNIDLAPTLMGLMGRDRCAIWDGRSFADSIKSDVKGDEPHEQIVLSQCCHVCQRSVRWDRWLYIRTYHCGFHLFPQEMVFDIENDPHEQHDLAEAHPELCREGAWRLANWHDQQMKKMAATRDDVTDPLWTVIHEGGPFHARLGGGVYNASIHDAGGNPTKAGFQQYLERLNETGRAEGAKALREKYADWV